MDPRGQDRPERKLKAGMDPRGQDRPERKFKAGMDPRGQDRPERKFKAGIDPRHLLGDRVKSQVTWFAWRSVWTALSAVADDGLPSFALL
ncbi:hypothetical protein CDL15_Pgr000971 [Punica granatum]|uniref:Uncharacterized protein n=1 Tax=Punica granatum TaxID=22663 RepID=A0A218XJ99_PUNGR|nr:hypothetical protein CDL15_Pgr000971 [Punica granatum]